MGKKATFEATVKATPTIADAFQPGIQALVKRDKGFLKDVQVATGSVALDSTLHAKKLHQNANRWDYGIGLPGSKTSERVLWLEPHRGGSGESKTVIKKLAWLKEWLRNEAPALDKLPKTFVWLVSNTENPNDRKRRTRDAENHGLRRLSPMLSLAGV